MKIVQINTHCNAGSIGKICVAVSERLNDNGVENYIFYAFGNSNYVGGKKYASDLYIKFQALKSRVFGNYGFNSQLITRKLISELESIGPDIVHLHNLHGHNVHLGMLFSYFKKNNIKIFWTFHDCWAFTAYCPYYDLAKCNQWGNNGCRYCPQIRRYSWFFDRSREMFNRKKALFTGLDLTIITPSQWLADQVKQSFLKNYDVMVINNGIGLSIFTPKKNDFKARNSIENKYLIVGTAFIWVERKGLDVFIELSKRLDDRFQIVLVGTDDNVDKQLPSNIISIHRTNNQAELADIYSAADVFVNPTREENFPTTHMESLACGTPVVTFDTGGSKEMLDSSCGIVVPKNDIDAMEKAIRTVCIDKPFSSEACVARAKQYDQRDKFNEYISLYK